VRPCGKIYDTTAPTSWRTSYPQNDSQCPQHQRSSVKISTRVYRPRKPNIGPVRTPTLSSQTKIFASHRWDSVLTGPYNEVIIHSSFCCQRNLGVVTSGVGPLSCLLGRVWDLDLTFAFEACGSLILLPFWSLCGRNGATRESRANATGDAVFVDITFDDTCRATVSQMCKFSA
jgi:hypothetical protein